MSKNSIRIRKIAISSLFLSICLVLKTYFSISVPLFGENGMRIGISGIFSIMPAILFGPLYGGIVSGLSDLLGYFLKPAGPFMPLLTVTAFLGGFMRGLIWIALRKKRDKRLRMAVLAIVLALGTFGAWNAISLGLDGVTASYYDGVHIAGATDGMHMISRLLITRTQAAGDPAGSLATYITSTTTALIAFAVFGLVLVLVDLFISKNTDRSNKMSIMGTLLALIVSGLVVTTLNTVILRNIVYQSWRLLPFVVVWLSRAIEEIVVNTVTAYFVVALCGILSRQNSIHDILFGAD